MKLAEFAQHDPVKGGVACWMCGIPERAEAEEGYRSGVKGSTIARWLRSIYGEVATPHKVAKHLRDHVKS